MRIYIPAYQLFLMDAAKKLLKGIKRAVGAAATVRICGSVIGNVVIYGDVVVELAGYECKQVTPCVGRTDDDYDSVRQLQCN
jgi:hypothetical protein